MGNRISSTQAPGPPASSPPAHESKEGEMEAPTPLVVAGRDLEGLLHGPDNVLEKRWLLFASEDAHDCRLLEAHCEGDRYYSRFVYSHSKVPLSGDRYINANYVLGHSYIASQAPLSISLVPFWEMVMRRNVSIIVMLTRLVEGSRTKALRYWPTTNQPIRMYDDKEFDIEDQWKVELLEKTVYDDNILRRDLKITRMETNEEAKVSQLHFVGWPDHGCPSEIPEVISLLAGVEELAKRTEGPILVHCSAGIGRTGTFIVIRHELLRAVRLFQEQSHYARLCDEYDAEGKVVSIKAFLADHEFHIDEVIRELRKDRKMMVQKEEQMIFCYEFFLFLLEDESADYLIEEFLLPIFFPNLSEAE